MHFSKPPLGTPLDWENPLNDGTVLALAMNEGHGDKVQDLSLNRNHGTLHNFAFPPTTASGWNPGQTGVGLNFNGTNNYISCGDKPIFELPKYTWSMLIKSHTAPGTLAITQPLLNGNEQFQFAWDHTNGDFKQCAVHKSGATWHKAQIASVVTAGIFHHVVGTYDGTNLSIYLDGNLENAVPAGTPNVAAGALSINVAGSNLACSIDQPRIQSRVWTAKEVRDYAINPWQVYLDEG